MPEDLKLSQIGSSQLPPPFRGFHSPRVRKHCQIIFACYFRKSSIKNRLNVPLSIHRLYGMILQRREAILMFHQLSGTKSRDSVHETVVPKTTTYKESRVEAGNRIDVVRLLSFRLRVGSVKPNWLIKHTPWVFGFFSLDSSHSSFLREG